MGPDIDRDDIIELLAGLEHPVRLIFFTQTFECETCLPTRQLLDEIVADGDRVTLEEYNLLLDHDQVAAYGVDRAPTVAVVGEPGQPDTGIRFVGIPAGYELRSLLDAILMVSTRESGLSQPARALLATIDEPIRLKVFVTPT
jgi:alkyl hydroperoxide reductase subunit AhpF